MSNENVLVDLLRATEGRSFFSTVQVPCELLDRAATELLRLETENARLLRISESARG